VKWLFASLSVVVAGAVAGFAIYTWGWHNADATSNASAERETATVDADEFAEVCFQTKGIVDCRRVGEVVPLAPRIWRTELREHPKGKAPYNNCFAIHLDQFRVPNYNRAVGYSGIDCSAGSKSG
jgi:hypothetical protein